MDQVLNAIHETAINSEISAKKIAAAMVIGHQTFLNKANPLSDSNFTSAQIFQLIYHSQNPLIPQALLSLVAIDGEITDLLTAVLIAGTEQGKLREALLDANADSKINQRELNQIVNRGNAVIKAVQGVMATARDHAEKAVD